MSFVELDSTLRYGVYLISGIGLNLRNYKCIVNTRKKSSKLSPTGDQDACSSKLWFDVANRSLKSNYGLSYPAIPQRRYRESWVDEHKRNIDKVVQSNASVVLLGDSLLNGLERFKRIWNDFFVPRKTLNLSIGGDRTQNVLWRLQESNLPRTAQFLVILAGTNNCNFDRPKDIADGVVSIAMVALEMRPGLKVIILGLLPREIYNTLRRRACIDVNFHIKRKVESGNLRGLYFLEPDNEWVISGSLKLNLKLYHTDFLHLSYEGNVKLAKSIINKIENLAVQKKSRRRRYIFCGLLSNLRMVFVAVNTGRL